MKMPNWGGRTAVIVCAGPSLSDDQLSTIGSHAVPTIAVNTAYMYAPWADAVFGSDFMFWKVHYSRIRAQCKHSALWTTDSSAAERFNINRQRGGQRDGLGTTVCHAFGNSGMNAINVAYLWGARKILLIGMDMREIDGKKHRHGDHEKGLVQAQLFPEWLHKAKPLARDLKANGCDVVNCTPGSALQEFRMSTIEKELA